MYKDSDGICNLGGDVMPFSVCCQMSLPSVQERLVATENFGDWSAIRQRPGFGIRADKSEGRKLIEVH